MRGKGSNGRETEIDGETETINDDHRAVIGAGTYGCVVYPAVFPDTFGVPWERVSEKAYVSKVFFRDGDVDEEWDNYVRVKNVDADHRFTVKCLGKFVLPRVPACVVDFCQKNGKPLPALAQQIVYEMAGRQLLGITHVNGGSECDVEREPQQQCFDRFGDGKGKTCRFRCPCFEDVIPGIADCVKGVAAMSRAGLMHGDINPKNLLFDGRRVVLIDFGQSTSHASFRDDGVFTSKLLPLYPFYPPEMPLLSYVMRGIDFDVERLRNRLQSQYAFRECLHIFTHLVNGTELFEYLKNLQLDMCRAASGRETVGVDGVVGHSSARVVSFGMSAAPAFGADEDDTNSSDSSCSSDNLDEDSMERAYDVLAREGQRHDPSAQYPCKFDIFSLGMSLFVCFVEFQASGRMRRPDWCCSRILPLLARMCAAKVCDRISVTDAVREWSVAAEELRDENANGNNNNVVESIDIRDIDSDSHGDDSSDGSSDVVNVIVSEVVNGVLENGHDIACGGAPRKSSGAAAAREKRNEGRFAERQRMNRLRRLRDFRHRRRQELLHLRRQEDAEPETIVLDEDSC